MAQPSTFPRSHLLIFGPNSVQSLLPVTPISQVEALLDDHRIEDVIQLVDQQRKKVQSKLVVDASEVRRSSFSALSFVAVQMDFRKAEELAYVYQRLGFQCLRETRFEDAGFCLFQGELDPRILISYFPSLRGTLLDAHPTLDVFAGVAECMPPYDSIDDLSTSLPSHFPPTPNTRNDALCARLTCSRGQLSMELFAVHRAEYS
jgi:hypothetical protein